MRVLFLFLASITFLLAEEPKALWLTWQKSPESTMVIHWLTPLEKEHEKKDDWIFFRKKGETEWVDLEGAGAPLLQSMPYRIHSIEVFDLEPDTIYQFRLDKDIYEFLTAPKNLDKPIRFIEGGDIYHDDIQMCAKMNRLAASKDPLFAVCGGDLAYSCSGLNRNKEKGERWVEWLSCWTQTMRTDQGRLIPMVPVIGNHEVIGKGLKAPSQASFFYHLFSLPEDDGYRAIHFEKYLSLFLLDSNHTHSVSGEQTKWLENKLKCEGSALYKFPVYHVPAYPSCRSYSRATSTEIRTHWVPLFEKYGVTAVFEHDDHLYKRTYLIRNGAKDPTGLLYLGDGAWGVNKPRKSNRSWYLEKTASIRHLFLVTLCKEKAHFEVLKEEGDVFESFTR